MERGAPDHFAVARLDVREVGSAASEAEIVVRLLPMHLICATSMLFGQRIKCRMVQRGRHAIGQGAGRGAEQCATQGTAQPNLLVTQGEGGANLQVGSHLALRDAQLVSCLQRLLHAPAERHPTLEELHLAHAGRRRAANQNLPMSSVSNMHNNHKIPRHA